MRKNNRAARATRFLVQSFDVVSRKRRRENLIFEVLRRVRTLSSKSFIRSTLHENHSAWRAKQPKEQTSLILNSVTTLE